VSWIPAFVLTGIAVTATFLLGIIIGFFIAEFVQRNQSGTSGSAPAPTQRTSADRIERRRPF
jgi:hypothetical protein